MGESCPEHTSRNMKSFLAIPLLASLALARPDSPPPSYAPAAPAYPDEPAKYTYSYAVMTTIPTITSEPMRRGTGTLPPVLTTSPCPTVVSRRSLTREKLSTQRSSLTALQPPHTSPV